MQAAKTPQAMRRHVVILGDTNVGKSTLFNALTGQDNSIVSPSRGTTTDPVQKAMELIPFGPIVLVDTAGYADSSELGRQRMQKTRAVSRRADAALYVADATAFSGESYREFAREGLPHLLVFTKCDIAGEDVPQSLQAAYPDAEFLSGYGEPLVERLRQRLSALLTGLEPEEVPLIGDLVPSGGTVILVMPIDSEAPKGRIILPQVQVLRDCLDHGIKSMVVRETELESAVRDLSAIDLVVTDSQAFPIVNQILPAEIPLTSFSMLLARQRGNFSQLLAGVDAVEHLPDGAFILLLEGCTHNSTHEDIGRVKIPALLRNKTGKQFVYDIHSGYDFPEDVSGYHLVIQCGGCMLAPRELLNRLQILEQRGIPVTNYGILLAWGSGILERCRQVFSSDNGNLQ